MAYHHTRARLTDTIVARSTAVGAGAIAIVRLSGPHAPTIAEGLAKGPLAAPYTLRRTPLFDAAGAILDDAMVVQMPGPNSYTGEHVVELHLHGGEAVVTGVMAACLLAGARGAEPGEFTLRAFVRGRMDLAQAEAVGALIHAQDDAAKIAALKALNGDLSRHVASSLHDLEGVAAAWLAGLDFPDDTPGVSEVDGVQVATLRRTAQALGALADHVSAASQRRQGVVLMGASNTGKSTLVNLWAGYERALVDAAPGTTRDVIEVPLMQQGLAFSAWDTAGQRPGAQAVEARGMALGVAQAHKAALVVWLVAADAPVWPPKDLPGPVWLVGAQADRYDAPVRASLIAAAREAGGVWQGFVSGHTQEGSEALRTAIGAHLRAQAAHAPEVMGNARHKAALCEAQHALQALLEAHTLGMPLDVLLTELQVAIRALGHVVGRDVDAAVIDRIFRDFCIGK